MPIRKVFIRSAAIALALAAATLDTLAGSCLWKAGSEAGTFYVVGSVHILRPDAYPLPPAVEEAYTASDALVFEVDMAAMAGDDARRLVLSKAMLPGGETLRRQLAPTIYREVEQRYGEAGLPFDAFQQCKPWYVALNLSMAHMQKMGFAPTLGLDYYFHGKARIDGKPVAGLETVAFQTNLLDALAEGDQNAFMRRALEDLDLIDREMDRMLRAWREGDIATLGELMNESFKEYPDLYERFVLARNRDWAERLAAMATPGRTMMVVVGAAHLPGKDGLLELLARRGFRLEQL